MRDIVFELLFLLSLDLIFVAVFLAILVPLAATKRAAYAVLKRNFVGYFSNPTGYVFLCLFVLLTSLAAFWPHEFFAANLANLDQLNKFLPYIMLVFIPAITMSIWSEERRQGTDELLLTLPAGDFDIVIGKYLAAAAIFSASLLFSQLANFTVLVALSVGQLDTGLFFATYFGYWLVGLAMLSVGMVASFLTHNMTVGFILGAAFNAPLAFAARADVILPWARAARTVAYWSISQNFDDFGRGVISLSSLAYFLMLIVLGLYLSMVLIGKRHWSGGRDGSSLFGHYSLRTAALLLGAVSIVVFFNDHDRVRFDVTSGRVSSLSPKTREIIRNLKAEHPIHIHAFVSAHVPEIYVQTKFNLVSLLKEFDAMSGGKVKVFLHENLEAFSEEASLADKSFGIKANTVRTRSQGAFKDEEVLLGAAFTCGLEKVVVPFFDYGVPVEYELIRSIGTVAHGTRKKIGLVRTDAQMNGGFSFAGGMPRQIPKQEIIDELQKQYDVEEVDPSQAIEPFKYSVLMAVQPSSLGPAELDNFIAVVEAGQPTAIFEDPHPIFLNTAPGTGEPKQQPGGMMGMGGGPPQPKGDIRKLWKVLGLDPPGESGFGGFSPDIAWQKFNPYPKLQVQGIPDSWVFASNDAAEMGNSLNPDDPITSGLGEILFPVPGIIEPAADSDKQFTALVKTGELAGMVRYQEYRENEQNPRRLAVVQGPPRGKQLVLAARIVGKEASASSGSNSTDKKADEKDKTPAGPTSTKDDPKDKNGATEKKDDDKAADKKDDAKKADEKKPVEKKPVDCVYVSDIDLMSWQFLRIRARPGEDEDINWRFENVTFLLNIIDALSGDDAYIEIRKRHIRHSTLRVVEDRTRIARDEEIDQQLKFEEDIKRHNEDLKKKQSEIMKKLEERKADLEKKKKEGSDFKIADYQALLQQIALEASRQEQMAEVAKQKLERDRTGKIEKIRRETDLEIQKIQNWYKFVAVAIPPIPPLIVGLVVFARRRLREREGVSKVRLR